MRSRPEIDLGMLECGLTGILHRRAREEGISAPWIPGKDLQAIKSTSKSIQRGPTVKVVMAVDLGRQARGKHTGASEIMRKCSTSPSWSTGGHTQERPPLVPRLANDRRMCNQVLHMTQSLWRAIWPHL